MSKYFIFDLEMNQPSNTIIEIGYVVGDKKGKIYENESVYVRVEEEITPYITELTGISNTTTDMLGIHPDAVAKKINGIIERHNTSLKAVTWGAGDVRALLSQYPEISLHNRYLDMKTLYQMECIATNESMQSGLFKAASKRHIDTGTIMAHRAKDDAYVTYLLFVQYLNKFKKLEQMRKIWDT